MTAYQKDADGNVVSQRRLQSKRITVSLDDNTFWGKIRSVMVEPFSYGLYMAFMCIGYSFGMLIPLAPLYFLGGIIYTFAKNFKALF